MIPHPINEKNNFIIGYYQDTDLAEQIEQFFLKYKELGFAEPGVMASGVVNTKMKESLDVLLNKNPALWTRYCHDYLQPVLDEYVKKYTECNNVVKFNVQENINIQEYAPGSNAFNHWHCERASLKTSHRHLVFMTYLNDVEDCGQTAFLYQDVLIKPQKGLTLIWPSDWTFTHKGLPSKTQYKRIVTGWFSFIE